MVLSINLFFVSEVSKMNKYLKLFDSNLFLTLLLTYLEVILGSMHRRQKRNKFVHHLPTATTWRHVIPNLADGLWDRFTCHQPSMYPAFYNFRQYQ